MEFICVTLNNFVTFIFDSFSDGDDMSSGTSLSLSKALSKRHRTLHDVLGGAREGESSGDTGDEGRLGRTTGETRSRSVHPGRSRRLEVPCKEGVWTHRQRGEEVQTRVSHKISLPNFVCGKESGTGAFETPR